MRSAATVAFNSSPPAPPGTLLQRRGQSTGIIVLEDVGGETVTIAFGGPAVDFDDFVPEAQKMLDTVECKSA